jgi:hypothetical protein
MNLNSLPRFLWALDLLPSGLVRQVEADWHVPLLNAAASENWQGKPELWQQVFGQ